MFPHPSPRSPLDTLLLWIITIVVFVIAIQILVSLLVQWLTTAAPYVLLTIILGLPIIVWWKRRSYS